VAVAFVLYMTIFIYGLNVLRGVLEEKQTRVAEVVISSLPASRLLAGKVIGVGGVGLTQLVLWLSMSFLMYQVRQPILAKFGAAQTPLGLPDVSLGLGLIVLGFFVLGFMFYAGLFAAVGATVNSEQEAQQAQMPVVLLLVTSIMFLQNILTQPDSMLSRVLSMLPFSAPIVMPLRMTVAPVPPAEVAIALASVGLGAVGSVWLASRIYRVGLLMYGKRPSVREIFKWVGQK
jgi:ABC-2 type transport system permease protein